MLTVLHLLDPASGFQAHRTAQQLASAAGTTTRHSLLTLPDSMLAAAARSRTVIGRTRPDLIHAWGLAGLLAAILHRRIPLIYSPSDEPTDSEVRWVVSASRSRSFNVACPSHAVYRRMAAAGLPPDRLRVIRCGVDFSRVRPRRDEALRRRLGFCDEDCVILGLGESTAAADHDLAGWAVGLLHELDPRYRLLLWGRGPRTLRALRRARRASPPAMLTLAEPTLGRPLEPEDLLPAADILLVSASGDVAPLPIAIGMAAALPIVATATASVSELLEDRHTALMAPPGRPRLLAARILAARRDPHLQWRIADTARGEAYAHFAQTRMVSEYRDLYDQSSRRTPALAEPYHAGSIALDGA